MVVKGSKTHKKASPRSAGQATSPHNAVGDPVAGTPTSRRENINVDDRRSSTNGVTEQRLTPGGRGLGGQYRPGPGPMAVSAPVRGYRCCSESAEESGSSGYASSRVASNLSSRATSPETDILHHETLSQKKKREIVDRSMEVFIRALCKWFVQEFGIISHAGSGRGTKRSRDSFGSSSNNSTSSGAQKRQLDGDGHLGAGGNDEGEGAGDGGGKKRAKTLDVAELLLACPFFKRDPVKYGKIRTCCGPGFPTLHRLKEHLWRRHKLPDYPCARCHTGFNANQDLIAHLRAPASLQCTISDDCPPEGIDAEKYKKIKERKYPNKTDDARKWEDIFQIIFPDDLIPSPYMSGPETKSNSGGHRAKEAASLAAYIERELVPEVRRQLAHEVDREFEAVDGRMQDRTAELVQLSISRVIRVWEHSHGRSDSSARPSPAPDSGVATPQTRASPPPYAAPAVPSFAELPPDAVSALNDADFSLDVGGPNFLDQLLLEASFAEGSGAWDSAYGTIDSCTAEDCRV